MVCSKKVSKVLIYIQRRDDKTALIEKQPLPEQLWLSVIKTKNNFELNSEKPHPFLFFLIHQQPDFKW